MLQIKKHSDFSLCFLFRMIVHTAGGEGEISRWGSCNISSITPTSGLFHCVAATPAHSLYRPLDAVVFGALLPYRRASSNPGANKKDLLLQVFLVWRRRRDLNSRAALTTYTLSRGASSANLSTSPNIKKYKKMAERQRFELWVLSHH